MVYVAKTQATLLTLYAVVVRSVAVAKGSFKKKKNLSSNKFDLNVRKKDAKCYIWSIEGYGAENWKLREKHENNRKVLEMWC